MHVGLGEGVGLRRPRSSPAQVHLRVPPAGPIHHRIVKQDRYEVGGKKDKKNAKIILGEPVNLNPIGILMHLDMGME